VKAIESLRFASGDEDIRSPLYDELGEALFEDFASVRDSLEKRLTEWGDSDEEGDTEEGAPKKGLPERKKKKLLDAKSWERDARLLEVANALRKELGGDLFEDHNLFREKVEAAIEKLGVKLSVADLKAILRAVSWRVETALPVIAKIHKPGKCTADPLHGRYEAKVKGKLCVVEYESDSDLRDTEQVPLLEKGGIETFIRREVLPYTPDAWINEDAAKIGYEVSFTRYFYKPQPLRTLAEIRADILALEKETVGLLGEIVGEVGR
jgi:type I restriction enzyme M protein